MLTIKIYPSKHEIRLINESRVDTELCVPISYINLDYNKCEIKKTIEPDFLVNGANSNIRKAPLIPGEKIDGTLLDDFIFNSKNEICNIEDAIVKEELMPMTEGEFVPNNFSYKLTVKKNISYKNSSFSNKKYNINIACLNDKDSTDLSLRMSKIFTDAANRQLLPNNIMINNNKKSLDDLLKISKNTDFLFVETIDGKKMDSETELSISGHLDNNINVWIGCENHYQYKKDTELGFMTFIASGLSEEFNIKRPLVTKDGKVRGNHYFNILDKTMQLPKNTNIHTIFDGPLSPVIILEHKGRGFEIISHNSILQNPVEHKELIYEVMLYVYSISYKSSDRVNEWISYTVPNYEVINGSLVPKTRFDSRYKIDDLVGLKENEYSIYEINIFNNNKELPEADDDLLSTVDNIKCIDIINNKLVFKMDETVSYSEPRKNPEWLSIYNAGKIYYVKRIYYYIESNIEDKFYVLEKGNDLIIKLYPFVSSKHKINLTTDVMISIPIRIETENYIRIIDEKYIVYLDNETNILYYIIESDYEEKPNYIKLAEITVKQDMDNTYLTDVRQLGGGLREDAIDNYDLLDIGHIDGRPYRKGGTLIITMPTKYEPYKDMILEAINKYKVGEDYVAIFFEDRKE